MSVRRLWSCLTAVALTCGLLTAPTATALSFPNLSYCLPSQLAFSAEGYAAKSYNTKTHVTQRYVEIRTGFVNISPVPCYLAGVPNVQLLRNGTPVAVRVERHDPPISSVDPTSPLDLGENVLIPGGFAELPVAWLAPWCGKKTLVAMSVSLVTGSVVSAARIPTPPCAAGRAALTVDPWFVPPR